MKMYCSGCGTQLQSGLIYCSRCGRRVAEDLAAGEASWTSNPMAITACIAGVGLFVFMLLIRSLTRSQVAPDILLPIAFLYMGALFGICFTVMRYGSKAKPTASVTVARDTGELDAPAYLRPVTTAQLEEGRELGLGSVTDATTRTLDEVLIERKK